MNKFNSIRNSKIIDIFKVLLTLLVIGGVVLFLYFLSQILSKEPNLLRCLNFIFIVLILFFIYDSIKERKLFPERHIITALTMYILNRCYDGAVIEEKLKIPLWAFNLILLFTALCSLLVYIFFNYVSDKKNENDGNKSNRESRDHTSERSSINNENFGDNAEKNNTASSIIELFRFLFHKFKTISVLTIAAAILIVLPSYAYLSSYEFDIGLIFNQFFSEGINKWVSYVLATFLILFLFGALLFVIVRIMNSMLDAIFKRNKNNLDLFAIILCFIVTAILYRNDFEFTENDALDVITKGDIFSFPLILAIIIPVLYSLIYSMADISKNSALINNIKCQLMGIIEDIILSLFRLIRFVTSDLLKNLTDIVLLDNSIDDTEHEEGDISEEEQTSED